MKQLFLFMFLFCGAHGFSKTGRELIAENGLKASVEPLLTTQWSQDGGENFKLPITANGVHAKTGCGATALAQIMNYWKYPSHGYGNNFYYWESDTGGGQVLFADFENTYYDWDNMIPQYKGNSSATQTQIDAVSTLMSHIGIALEMKYTTDEGTATQIEYIHTVLKKFYGYNPYSLLVRQSNYSMDEWLTLIYKELSEGRPVLMGGKSSSNNNHIFVADGYDADGLVHLNLGHANRNDEDKYYDLTLTNQTYTTNMRMIIGVCPQTLENELVCANINKPGMLVEALGGEQNIRKICRLKVVGSINDNDINWLKELSKTTTGQLSYIDLSDCTIEGNTIPESAFDSNLTLQEIILPNNIEKIGVKAFRNCTGLYAIQLPEELKTIGNYAFSNCRYLGNVNLPKTLVNVGINPFRYDKFDTFVIDVDNPSYMIINNALISKNGSTLYSMPCKHYGDYQVPDGVKVIKKQTFVKTCEMSSVVFPSSLLQVESNAFMECYSLTDIYNYANTAPSIVNDSFDSASASCVLHVPSGCIDDYEQKGWTMFTRIVDDILLDTSVNEQICNSKIDEKEMYDISGGRITSPNRNQIYIVKEVDGTVHKFISK